MMPVNTHAVPVKQWDRWSQHARWVFNAMMESMANQSLVVHTNAIEMPDEHWQVTRWNASWNAASACDEQRKMAILRAA